MNEIDAFLLCLRSCVANRATAYETTMTKWSAHNTCALHYISESLLQVFGLATTLGAAARLYPFTTTEQRSTENFTGGRLVSHCFAATDKRRNDYSNHWLFASVITCDDTVGQMCKNGMKDDEVTSIGVSFYLSTNERREQIIKLSFTLCPSDSITPLSVIPILQSDQLSILLTPW